MEVGELKKYISEDINRLTLILQQYGCHDIWRVSEDEVRCAIPEHNNRTGMQIKLNESLYTAIYEMEYHGDLIGALQLLSNTSFKEVVLFLSALFGLNSNKPKLIKDPLKLNGINDLMENIYDTSDTKNKEYNANILHDYLPFPHISLLQEGISPQVARSFRISYDPRKDRIIFPHFDWVDNDKIVGIKGRTILDKTTMDLLGVPKYWNYIKGYKKTHNLYGFGNAKDNLNKSKQLILFEGEKSVLKQFTLKNGKGYSVAVGGHTISQLQADFIVQNTPNDCEIIIAFDKDVDDIGYLESECEKFKPLKKVSYVIDEDNKLNEKDAPIDAHPYYWEWLLKNRKEV